MPHSKPLVRHSKFGVSEAWSSKCETVVEGRGEKVVASCFLCIRREASLCREHDSTKTPRNICYSFTQVELVVIFEGIVYILNINVVAKHHQRINSLSSSIAPGSQNDLQLKMITPFAWTPKSTENHPWLSNGFPRCALLLFPSCSAVWITPYACRHYIPVFIIQVILRHARVQFSNFYDESVAWTTMSSSINALYCWSIVWIALMAFELTFAANPLRA